MSEAARRAGRAVAVAAGVTLCATLLSYFLPESWAATGVGFLFLGASYWLVLRDDDGERIRNFGLSFGGLFEREPLDGRRMARETLVALGSALALAALVFPLFWLGFRLWWQVDHFRPASLTHTLDDAFGQLLVIALPEETFFRGYLQSELDRAFGKPVRLLGAALGLGLLVASAIFAFGHLLTEVNVGRLAVFFPALLFGWLRARTGGVGAGIVFHALCNLFASYLLRSYGLAR